MPTIFTPTASRVHARMKTDAINGLWSGNLPDLAAQIGVTLSAINHAVGDLRATDRIVPVTRGRKGFPACIG